MEYIGSGIDRRVVYKHIDAYAALLQTVYKIGYRVGTTCVKALNENTISKTTDCLVPRFNVPRCCDDGESLISERLAYRKADSTIPAGNQSCTSCHSRPLGFV